MAKMIIRSHKKGNKIGRISNKKLPNIYDRLDDFCLACYDLETLQE